ncbi:MAG: haloacid dehalogenase-like hydrolase [Coxiellaceae bacterium]|nr:haloacid dehalogenase-like hydrolase [Coxiellaceae bacterium]
MKLSAKYCHIIEVLSKDILYFEYFDNFIGVFMLRFMHWCGALLLLLSTSVMANGDLASWQDGESKRAIIEFVNNVTAAESPQYVPEQQRIAVFDNDGTLWAEQPMYFQLYFAIDRIKALAAQHPEWQQQEPFASVLRGDLQAVLAGGEKALLKLIMVSHAGMTTAQFEKIVTDWLTTAKHPITHQPYTQMVYQPMLELIAYLKANHFEVYIVTGGGIEFVRAFSEKVYGIPRENVIGSSIKTTFEIQQGVPVLMRLAEINFIDDGAGKPVGINAHIGRKPIAAFGNSVGDKEMLQWTQSGEGARLMMLVHHDDAKREWAYGANSKIGTFSDALMATAKKNGWHVISIKNDWGEVFKSK